MTTENQAAPAEDTPRPEETAAPEDQAPEESAEPTSEGEDPPEKETEDSAASNKDGEKPRKKAAASRIRELTKKYREAEREADYWKQQAQASQQSEAPEQAPRPSQDDFDSHEEWVEALADWKADQRIQQTLAERDKKESESRHEKAKASRMDAFAQKVAQSKEKHTDFDAVAGNPGLKVTEQMLDVLQDLEDGAEVLYFLGHNPDTAAEIAEIQSPHRMAAMLARIEDSLTDTPDEPPETTTQAPEVPPDPPKTVGGKPRQRPTDSTDIKAWMERRAKEVGNRR